MKTFAIHANFINVLGIIPVFLNLHVFLVNPLWLCSSCFDLIQSPKPLCSLLPSALCSHSRGSRGLLLSSTSHTNTHTHRPTLQQPEPSNQPAAERDKMCSPRPTTRGAACIGERASNSCFLDFLFRPSVHRRHPICFPQQNNNTRRNEAKKQQRPRRQSPSHALRTKARSSETWVSIWKAAKSTVCCQRGTNTKFVSRRSLTISQHNVGHGDDRSHERNKSSRSKKKLQAWTRVLGVKRSFIPRVDRVFCWPDQTRPDGTRKSRKRRLLQNLSLSEGETKIGKENEEKRKREMSAARVLTKWWVKRCEALTRGCVSVVVLSVTREEVVERMRERHWVALK